jgi:hypothetical protein
MIASAAENAEAALNGLLLFLLNLSIRMRLDRVEGIGGICWLDSFATEGTLTGFFKGLEMQSECDRMPKGFVDDFKSFLSGIQRDDMHALFSRVASRLNPKSPELPVVKSHLNAHADSFFDRIKAL